MKAQQEIIDGAMRISIRPDFAPVIPIAHPS